MTFDLQNTSSPKINLEKGNVTVIDNFYLEEDYKELLSAANNVSYTSGWSSNQNADPHGHWNRGYVYDVLSDGSNLADISDNIPDLHKKVWQNIKNVYNLNDMILIRCYMNAHTYGVEGYIHTDSPRDDEWTIVTYMNEKWDPNWAGETIVLDDNDDIIKAVLPKRNRAVIFPGKMKHAARSVSRICYDLRRTLMFKFRAKRDDNFEKLSSFLRSVEANKYKHTTGSLHDHLVRNYSLLKNKNFDTDLCFAAGLHSIFGTNAFDKTVLNRNQSNIVSNNFGEKVELLTLMFSVLERPTTLENPIRINDETVTLKLRNGDTHDVSLSVFNDLRVMECANLIDQKCLKEEKFKNLIDFWNSITKDKI